MRKNGFTLAMWKRIKSSVLLIYQTFHIIDANVQYNDEERSQRGIALLNHTYKSLYTEDYPSCLKSCMSDSQCKSFNYWWNTLQCDLNNRTKYSAEAKFLKQDITSTYMGLTREPDINKTSYRSCRHVHPSNGNGEYLINPTLSGNPSTVYCDMTTDGGGWTAIQMVLFTESNLHFQDRGYSFTSLSNYGDHRQSLASTALLQLRNEFGFQQLRFYCHKKKVGTVVHIMTNLNPLGEAVVNYFTDDNLASSRPKTCGSYTVFPDDNSTLSKDCTKLGWNGSSADGKWSSYSYTSGSRVQKTLVRHEGKHRLRSAAALRDCDDWEGGEASLTPGDTWALFLR